MARPPVGVPLSTWHRVSDAIGKKVAESRKAPGTNLHEIEALLIAQWHKEAANGNVLPVSYVQDQMAKHIANVHDHAKLSEGGQGPYPVEKVTASSTPIHDMTVERTTAGDNLKDLVYGDQYGNMLDVIAQSKNTGHPKDLTRASIGGHRDAWNRPVHLFQNAEASEIAGNDMPAYSWGGYGLVYLDGKNPGIAQQFDRVLGHEYRHAGSHNEVDRPKDRTKMGQIIGYGGLMSDAEAMQLAGKHFPNDPYRQKEYAKSLQHGHRWEELETQIGELKGYHYGLTGQLVRTPEENVRFLGNILNGKTQIHTAPGQPGRAFGDDPIMNYGPNPGQPATKKNHLEALIRDIYPRGGAGEKKAIFDNTNKMMNNSKPQKAPYV
jgi:hypothetical protein